MKQKTEYKNRIQDREAEIERLRNQVRIRWKFCKLINVFFFNTLLHTNLIKMFNLQLTTKSFSTTSQTELENRLHALTESLIQKQTMLEALSTEKNSLGLQLERLEVGLCRTFIILIAQHHI